MLRLILLASLAVAASLEETFSPVLEPPQSAVLGPAPVAEAMVDAMRPEQKAAARSALEKAALSPEERARGLQLLDPVAAYRAEAQARGLLPTPAGELTAEASAALARGDNEAAARFAAEALARDPSDDKAFGILKLTERRVGSSAAKAVEAASVVPVSFATPPTPRAAALMNETVAARRSGDMDRTLKLALEAMRADPTSPDVQGLYKLVLADRARQQARVQRTLSFMEAAAQALGEGRAAEAQSLAGEAAKLDPDSAAYWTRLRRSLEQRGARKPAPKQPDPGLPLLPLFTGSLLLTVGSFAWYHWGRDKASRLQRDATILGIAGGMATLIYLGWLALPAVGTGGPTLAPAGGPALRGAVQWVAQKGLALRLAVLGGAVGAAVAQQTLPDNGYSYSRAGASGQSKPKPDRIDQLLRPNGKPIGADGSSPKIRLVKGNIKDAERFFDQLRVGGKDVTPPRYQGKMVEFPDGRRVGLRPVSDSGPPTIDTHSLGVGFDKVKFIP